MRAIKFEVAFFMYRSTY